MMMMMTPLIKKMMMKSEHSNLFLFFVTNTSFLDPQPPDHLRVPVFKSNPSTIQHIQRSCEPFRCPRLAHPITLFYIFLFFIRLHGASSASPLSSTMNHNTTHNTRNIISHNLPLSPRINRKKIKKMS